MCLNRNVSDLHPHTYFCKMRSFMEDMFSAAQGRRAAFPLTAQASLDGLAGVLFLWCVLLVDEGCF